MSKAFLYKIANCKECRIAKKLLVNLGYEVHEYNLAGDPLSVLGAQVLFKKTDIIVPLILIEGQGAFLLSGDKKELLKMKIDHINEIINNG